MRARGPCIEPVDQPWVDPGAFAIKLEAFDGAGIVVDPRVIHPLRPGPAVRTPSLERESTPLGSERGETVRADGSLWQGVTHLHLSDPRRPSLAIGKDPVAPDALDFGHLGRGPAVRPAGSFRPGAALLGLL